jgi:nicotinamidase-related amidase
MSKKNNVQVHLVIVDPQNDFCVADDGKGNKGSLVVPGALEDMQRVAKMVNRIGDRLADIHVTLDSHQGIGIERPKWWKRVSDGAMPAPFTILGIHPDKKRIVKFNADATGLHPTEEEYTTYMPSYARQGGPTGKGVFGYLEALAAKGRYPHVVWPVHCCVGSWGWSIVPELSNELIRWEQEQFARVNYVTKGNNPWTEHFSGVQAEVQDPGDPTTQVNTALIQTLESADIIALTGEALSHCVANTGRDIANCFTDPKYVAKLVLLTDATSNVSGFDFLGDAFVKELVAKGMQISTTADFLA